MNYVPLLKKTDGYRELMRECEEGRPFHAYLFESGDLAALDTLARLFIIRAEGFCDDGVEAKRVFDGSYFDILCFPRPEKKGKTDVEDAAFITDTAYLQPSELSAKYFIIAPTEPMSAPVQNKLLKTLEEPPASARFLILSAGGLLPTVVSRCRRIRLEPFGEDTVCKALIDAGFDTVVATLSAAASRGQIGTAVQLAERGGGRKAFEAAANFLLHTKRSPQILPAAAEIIAQKDDIQLFIDYLELLLRDVMAYRTLGASGITLKNAASDIAAIGETYSDLAVLNIMPKIRRARARLRAYGNTAGCVDELLFSILEVKAKCPKS
ncbi:MAG: hypothetical protein K2M95_04245 [Clostridiales bacterium]|nr:hypothetical protein [Clostridiales bacterium]